MIAVLQRELDASSKVVSFLQTQLGTPEYTGALDAAAQALSALGVRIDQIDQAFAARQPLSQ